MVGRQLVAGRDVRCRAELVAAELVRDRWALTDRRERRPVHRVALDVRWEDAVAALPRLEHADVELAGHQHAGLEVANAPGIAGAAVDVMADREQPVRIAIRPGGVRALFDEDRDREPRAGLDGE